MNVLIDVVQGLFRLQELRKLTLSDNEICRLPPDVANFTFLQELDISRNGLSPPQQIRLSYLCYPPSPSLCDLLWICCRRFDSLLIRCRLVADVLYGLVYNKSTRSRTSGV